MSAFDTFVRLGDRGITEIGKLAPLSIVLTALGILNTIRLARVKRREDQAKAIRETLNSAGTSAYILTWSLLGGMSAKVPLLELRDAIETRLGKPVAAQPLLDLLNDQLLIEPMIGKAWRDSGAIDRFRQEAFEFSRLSADIGSRIPLVHEALEQINAKLRVLLQADSTLTVNVRNDKNYRTLPPAHPGQPNDPLHRVMTLLLSDTPRNNSETFQTSTGFLNALAAATASASDRRILRLVHARMILPRWKNHFAERAAKDRDRPVRAEIAAQFQQVIPQEAGPLTSALDAALKQTHTLHQKEQLLRHNAAYILHTLKTSDENPKLRDAVQGFVQALAKKNEEEIWKTHALIRLKALGVGDPEIDVHLAIATGTPELLKSAMNLGATMVVGLDRVLHSHRQQLAAVGEVLLTKN